MKKYFELNKNCIRRALRLVPINMIFTAFSYILCTSDYSKYPVTTLSQLAPALVQVLQILVIVAWVLSIFLIFSKENNK